MPELTKPELLTCANAILEKIDPTPADLDLCDKLVAIAELMPGADEITERMLRELKGMLHPG